MKVKKKEGEIKMRFKEWIWAVFRSKISKWGTRNIGNSISEAFSC